jgi:hypothetical protein
MKATSLWAMWQGLVLSCALGFTPVGRARFLQWVTGLVLTVEEHTVTQSLVGLNAPDDWKALESFVEYGSWDLPLLQQATAQLAAPAQDHLFFGYHVIAGDDTKVHRSSENVWGVCTFHEHSARCPNRASTVRAHNWVFLGALHRHDEQPPDFLPVAGRLYFRKTQLPQPQRGPEIVFRTKGELMVDLTRQHANAFAGKHLLVVDGGYCRRSVLRPLVCPQPLADGTTPPRIDVITRMRCDAALYAPLGPVTGQRGRGAPLRWGVRLPVPKEADAWETPWQSGRVYVYGQWREVRWKELLCRWGALGHDVPVKAVVAQVEGYSNEFTLLCTATELTGLQVVEIFAARSRQEDGIRDLKQRLGWEEGRAWTRRPIERTTQTLFCALTCLRLLQRKLQEQKGDEGWFVPPWNKDKARPSVLDVQRLLREHRADFQALLARWVLTVTNGAPQAESGG